MRKRILSLLSVALLILSTLGPAVAAEVTTPAATIGETGYPTLQDAIDAVNNGAQIGLIELKKPAADITVNGDVYVDLNGQDIASVNVVSGTFYGMDSQTDDYQVDAQNHEGYGKIQAFSGNVQALPAGTDYATDGYLMVEEDGIGYSFHRITLRITDMVLRPVNDGETDTNPSLYYKSNFAGDELVAANIKAFGIALSITETPDATNMDTACAYSRFEGFQPGKDGNAESSTSTLLYGIMKESSATMTNKRNANLPIWGRAYALTNNNAYLFGAAVCRSLKEQAKLVNNREKYAELDKTQIADLVAMYRRYTSIMDSWNLNNIESSVIYGDTACLTDGKSLKLLAITSSFGVNTTQYLYDVAVAEGYDPENVIVGRLYASGCTLEKHLNHAPDKPVYQYTKISSETNGVMTEMYEEGTATLLDGLLDEDWDIIFMQQGAAQSPQLSTYKDYISQLRVIVDQHKTNPNAKFMWNMLWAYQSDSTQTVFTDIFASNQMYMYQSNVNAVLEKVVPRNDFDKIIPSGTVVQNARTSFFGDHLTRDTFHMNNLGGVMVGYGLFATITGKPLTEINIDVVKATNTNRIAGAPALTEQLTDAQKQVIIESVNNALADPFHVTQSLITEG